MIGRCIVLFVVMALASCGKKNPIPPGILVPDKMQAVLWDVIRADAFTTDFIKKDSAKNAAEENIGLQQKIFSMHHVSKEDFYTSYDYYKLNTTLMKDMIDTMLVRAERERSKKPVLKTLQTE
ncbi:MAG TPA: DUF4296 domain-containing protein [Ferruginibacter sp.]|nr:DUF4296 domain-containing protein [Ferruginibacter sp.]